MSAIKAAAKSLPKHVQAIIETTTGLDYERGSLKRTARPLPCPRCGVWTLAGLDADRIARGVHLDPQPLSPLGEAIILLGHEYTWSVMARINDRGREIDTRDAWHIRAKPAGTSDLDIHAEHRCGRRLPDELTARSVLPPKRDDVMLPIDPPF